VWVSAASSQLRIKLVFFGLQVPPSAQGICASLDGCAGLDGSSLAEPTPRLQVDSPRVRRRITIPEATNLSEEPRGLKRAH
jgi:hypothetical protein